MNGRDPRVSRAGSVGGVTRNFRAGRGDVKVSFQDFQGGPQVQGPESALESADAARAPLRLALPRLAAGGIASVASRWFDRQGDTTHHSPLTTIATHHSYPGQRRRPGSITFPTPFITSGSHTTPRTAPRCTAQTQWPDAALRALRVAACDHNQTRPTLLSWLHPTRATQRRRP